MSPRLRRRRAARISPAAGVVGRSRRGPTGCVPVGRVLRTGVADAGSGCAPRDLLPEITYLPSPWASAVHGLEELSRFWEAGRDGPNEPFTLVHEIVAVEGTAAVVRLAVDYQGPDTTRWRDLWLVAFDDDGRCETFEEWPFAPNQPDGH